MLHKMLQQFIEDVWWGSPDVLLSTCPPGTGDVSLTLAQLLPTAEVVVVTTPHRPPSGWRSEPRTWPGR